MFGTTLAPEIYQRLQRCVDRIGNIAEELTIHGRGIKEHKENRLAVLRRLRECELTLHQKSQLRRSKQTFI